MQKMLDIKFEKLILPSKYADYLGVQYTSIVSKEHKKEKGQFFTPTQISDFMGSIASKPKSPNISILDPGCGTAILTCSLIENIINTKTESIDLVAYESDYNLITYTEKSLQNLKEWLNAKKIEFTYQLFANDFILDIGKSKEKFDYVISNPPYFKLAKNDERVLQLKSIVNVQPNIYTLFMAISVDLLKENGEMIFITPRSFASGQYFNSFRDYFFSNINLSFIHLFKTRSKTFDRDKVLQELLIIKATKSKNNTVIISTSEGLKDIFTPLTNVLKTDEIINLKTKDKTLFLPTSDKEIQIISLFKSWKNKLIDFEIQISTGRVVSFRNKNHLFDHYQNTTVFLAPLYWLQNITKMQIKWPLFEINKSQYINITEETKSILIPNKNYIFLRRFSTKDDKSRLICSPYFSTENKIKFIGVENKLNYIYRLNGAFKKEEIIGISTLLNSDIYDTFFRTFNGNVNVSATEIRLMTFPPIETILEIGSKMIKSKDYSQENINQITNSILLLKKECSNA